MKIKDGVRFSTPTMAMCHATMVVRDTLKLMDLSTTLLVITGGIEQHEPPSKHVTGGALDYRTRYLGTRKEEFERLVRAGLGDGFDVVLEASHLHVEYDPKGE